MGRKARGLAYYLRQSHQSWAAAAMRASAFNVDDIQAMAAAWIDFATGPGRSGHYRLAIKDRASLIERAADSIAEMRKSAGLAEPIIVWTRDPDEFHRAINAAVRYARISPRDEFPHPVAVPVFTSATGDDGKPVLRRKSWWQRLAGASQPRPEHWVRIWRTPPWVPVLDGAVVLDCPVTLEQDASALQPVLRVTWEGFPPLLFAGGDLVPPITVEDGSLGEWPPRFARQWSRTHLDAPPGSELAPGRRKDIEQAVATVYRTLGQATPALLWYGDRAAYQAVADRRPATAKLTTLHQLLPLICKRSNRDGSRSWSPHQMQIGRLLREGEALPKGPATLAAWRIAAWRWKVLADPRWQGVALIDSHGQPQGRLDKDGETALLTALEQAAAVAWIAGADTAHLLDPVAG